MIAARAQPSRTAPRVKWHMLRRQKSDAAFLRENLVAALEIGAACEVDIVFTADGHALCLHDRTLDRETTGHGRVADMTRAETERLHQRGLMARYSMARRYSSMRSRPL